jgi:hypothetical protein
MSEENEVQLSVETIQTRTTTETVVQIFTAIGRGNGRGPDPAALIGVHQPGGR